MLHELKIDPTFVRPILDGTKTFDIRYNDRGFQAGDLVRFRLSTECDDNNICLIEDKVFLVTYVLNGYGLKNGFVVFGISKVKERLKGREQSNENI